MNLTRTERMPVPPAYALLQCLYTQTEEAGSAKMLCNSPEQSAWQEEKVLGSVGTGSVRQEVQWVRGGERTDELTCVYCLSLSHSNTHTQGKADLR